MEGTPDLLPLVDFAKRLGVVPHTARTWVRVGLRGVRLRTVRIGCRVFVRWGDYLEWQRRVDEWKPLAVAPTPKRRQADVRRCLAAFGL